jgi:hypothetical protein
MIIRLKNISILLVIIIFLLSFCLALQSKALEVETHSAINKYIAERTFLDEYLKTQLGISDGKDTFFKNKKVFDLIADGGKYEDNFGRYLNHFYNPLNNSGLLGNIPAKDWAIRPVGNQYADGQYSWFDARDYYLKALTSLSKTDRDEYFAETFRAVGQVMHLVQDMSVPAHTRGDKHPSFMHIGGDPYENRVTADKILLMGEHYCPEVKA